MLNKVAYTLFVICILIVVIHTVALLATAPDNPIGKLFWPRAIDYYPKGTMDAFYYWNESGLLKGWPHSVAWKIYQLDTSTLYKWIARGILGLTFLSLIAKILRDAYLEDKAQALKEVGEV